MVFNSISEKCKTNNYHKVYDTEKIHELQIEPVIFFILLYFSTLFFYF